MKLSKFLILIALISTYTGFSQTNKKDSTAVFILNKMSAVINDLESVTFNLSHSEDVLDADNNIVKKYSTSELSLSGPDKLLIKSQTEDGNLGFWYDGEFITFYNYDENNYVTLEAPETTIEMIDDMHEDFNFQFPAADFFYPAFTQDFMEQFDTIKFLGRKIIDGETCYHIMANNATLNVQLFISSKTYLLPKHFVIIYKNKSNIQYQSTFSNWSLNPIIPNAAFDFLPPPTANLISILKKS
ncbi:DUF2092 domain-containing protein [Tamlana sp. I1]|uniref:DUF2092 domain-containing protein n=1 Tax=Tamlana sp. I1 TaxID=2762061 RepID=UPI00188F9C93|nr:DUF2092 domain-containing protein [Tamlana sp. I1]